MAPFVSILTLVLATLPLGRVVIAADIKADPISAPTASPTDPSSQVQNLSMSAWTPTIDVISDIFSTDVKSELSDNVYVNDVSNFEWEVTLNDSLSLNPFLLCATAGRDGVVSVFSGLDSKGSVPMFTKGNLTCYIVTMTGPALQNFTLSQPLIKYALPLPAVLKIAKGLFRQIFTGYFFSDTSLCQAGFRLVLSPGLGQFKKTVNNIITRFQSDLRSDAFKQTILRSFYWVASTNSSSSAFSRSYLSSQKKLRDSHSQRQKDMNNGGGLSNNVRGDKWRQRIQPVLDGTVTCDFSKLGFSNQFPEIGVSGLCQLAPSDDQFQSCSTCVLTFLAYLIATPVVFYIESFPVVMSHNYIAAGIVQSGQETYYPYWDAGITGEGQIIQVADTGLDQSSCYFNDTNGPIPTTTVLTAAFDLTKRKVVQYVAFVDGSDISRGHGTHVSGTIAGKTKMGTPGNGVFAGVAYGAKIAFFDIGDSTGTLSIPSNIQTKLFPAAYRAGARIFSHSWGTSSNAYTYLDVQIDAYMYANSDALVIFAVGNQGATGLNTVGSPALSKNGIGVGASETSIPSSGLNMTHVAFFSSLGPTADGRIKPDILSTGYRVTSAAAGMPCGRYPAQGTSMATPVVSASAALVRQYFMDGWYPTGAKVAANSMTPSGALIKAILINSTVGMKAFHSKDGTIIPLGSPPDNYQGFGRVLLSNVLRLGDSVSLWLDDYVPISTGATHVFKFSIPSSADTSTFRVTLTWTDPSSSASASNIVLHDLDLYVTSDLTGTTYYPNGGTTKDSVNSVERVLVEDPQTSDVLTVYVVGASISTTTTQNYAIVASGSFIQAAWYCQDPSSSRVETAYRTSYCTAVCTNAAFRKNAICCDTTAGNTCTSASSTACDALSKPWDCFSPTPSPTRSPTFSPTLVPTSSPSLSPTTSPTFAPSRSPTAITQQPSTRPTVNPSQRPTSRPTTQPSQRPTSGPSTAPTRTPTLMPSRMPSRSPSLSPSSRPSTVPTEIPTMNPTTLGPSQAPSTAPSFLPTAPSQNPTLVPSARPSSSPTRNPSQLPTRMPTAGVQISSRSPTLSPSRSPTLASVQTTTLNPTRSPTLALTNPTSAPSRLPSNRPTSSPTAPSASPSLQPTRVPSSLPSQSPSLQPSMLPTSPSQSPTRIPSRVPSSLPSRSPSLQPSVAPTTPSQSPSNTPTLIPSTLPSRNPSMVPSMAPTTPSQSPSMAPTRIPTTIPSKSPSMVPSVAPTAPSQSPSKVPTRVPSSLPSRSPSTQPSRAPTSPTLTPSTAPSSPPSKAPTIV